MISIAMSKIIPSAICGKTDVCTDSIRIGGNIVFPRNVASGS